LDGTLALQRVRTIAQDMRNIELLYFVDMAALNVSESLNRHLSLHVIIENSRLN
jgi:hypothetical protein